MVNYIKPINFVLALVSFIDIYSQLYINMHLRFKQKKCGFYYAWLFPITEPSNDNDENKLGFPIIIGISCGGAFVLLLVIIVLINRFKKNKMYILRRKKQPNSGEDYELKKP